MTLTCYAAALLPASLRSVLVCRGLPLVLHGDCNERFGSWLVAEEKRWGAFAKFRKTNISFVISVCPSIRMEQLSSYWTDVLEVWYTWMTLSVIFENLFEKFKFYWNLTRITVLCMKRRYIYMTEFLLEWKVYPTEIVKKIKTHTFVFNNIFPRKSCLAL
jgi:hypothetical protein